MRPAPICATASAPQQFYGTPSRSNQSTWQYLNPSWFSGGPECFPSTKPCRMVCDKVPGCEVCPNHCSLRRRTISSRRSYRPIFLTCSLTDSFVLRAIYGIINNLLKHLNSNACILFSSAVVRVPSQSSPESDSQPYRTVDITTACS